MRLCTLVLPCKGEEVLLGMKKRGFGAGNYNGFGGKVNPDETPAQAAVREMFEETGASVALTDLKIVGEFSFYFPDYPDFNQNVIVYRIDDFNHAVSESEEMAPEWFAKDNLPFDRMWKGDNHIIPPLFGSAFVRAEVHFQGKGERVQKIVFHKPESKVIDAEL